MVNLPQRSEIIDIIFNAMGTLKGVIKLIKHVQTEPMPIIIRWGDSDVECELLLFDREASVLPTTT